MLKLVNDGKMVYSYYLHTKCTQTNESVRCCEKLANNEKLDNFRGKDLQPLEMEEE
jgi:hypothetical protein